MQHPKISIKTKLLLSFIFLLALTNLFIGFLSYRSSKSQLEASGKAMMQNGVHMIYEFLELKHNEVLLGETSLEKAQEEVKRFILGPMDDSGKRPINKNILLGKNGYFFVLDSTGLQVAHPTLEGTNVMNVRDLSNLQVAVAPQMINTGKAGGGFTYYSWYLPYSDKIEAKINYSLYYEPWDWVIIASIYESDFNMGLQHIVEMIALSIVITIFVAVLISFHVSGAITKPLIKITEKAKAIVENDFDMSGFEVKSSDESGVLAHYFKMMVEKLTHEIDNRKKAELSLKALNNDLELMVDDRTKALNTTIEELRFAHQQLVESERLASLGNIVSGVTHEINTPLGSSLSTASHIQHLNEKFKLNLHENKMSKADVIKYLDQMDEAVELLNFSLQRATDLVQSFKLIAVNQHSNHHTQFYICEYIEKTLLSLRHEYKNSGHQIEFIHQEDFLIKSYPGAYSQIITNLLMNAIIHAFAPNQKGHILISLEGQEQQIQLSFKDDGVGMSEEIIAHIFDPFFTTKKETGGSGLGLNLVYTLVTKQLMGSIQCLSKIGLGTEFIINVPITPPETIDQDVDLTRL